MPVEIAGHREAWQYSGAEGLEGWLETAPWVRGGGLRRVRVSSVSDYQSVVDVIEQRVMAIDRRLSDVRVVEVDFTTRDQFIGDIHMELGLDSHGAGPRALQRMSVGLRHIPLVIATPSFAPELFANAERAIGQLVDQLLRLDQPAPLCALIFGCHLMPSDRVTDDLASGMPTGLEVLRLKSQPYLLWSAYLHHRLGWESGGDRNLAESMSRETEAFSLGADEALERHLNVSATNLWQSLGEAARERAREWCTTYGQANHGFGDNTEVLLRDGILWQPTLGTNVRFKAWAARAMLLECLRGRGRDMLRACLVCLPLARSILESCFDLEVALRCSLRAVPSEKEAKGEGVLADLSSHRTSFENANHPMRQLYPEGSPAIPRSLAAFSSLGQLRHLSRWSRREERAISSLATVRNALAHGHYISWRVLSLLEEAYWIQRRSE